jgi:hypothetical protein
MAYLKFATFVLFSSLIAASAAQANLFVNGSFEDPTAPASSITCGTAFNTTCQGYYSPDQTNAPASGPFDIGGWSVIGKDAGLSAGGGALASVMQLGPGYTETDFGPSGGLLHFTAEDGSQSLDLTGEGNQGANGVKQSFASTVGTQYTLSFFLGHQDTSADGYAGPSSLDLYIDGVLVGTFDNPDVVTQDVDWKPFQFSFAAAGASTVVAFLNATPVGNNYTGLDNVVLTAFGIPEPGTLALFAVGFGLVQMRRRKTVAVER